MRLRDVPEGVEDEREPGVDLGPGPEGGVHPLEVADGLCRGADGVREGLDPAGPPRTETTRSVTVIGVTGVIFAMVSSLLR